MANLLKHHIESLRLRLDAPFPSEVDAAVRKAMRCRKWDAEPCQQPCECPFIDADDDELIDNDRYEGD